MMTVHTSQRALFTAARTIAKPLHELEDHLHAALGHNPRTTIALIEARREAEIEVNVGVDVLQTSVGVGPRIMATIVEVLEMHRRCVCLGREHGLPVTAGGDNWDTFAATRTELVAIAA